MRSFDYSKLRTKTWDTEILGYVAQIHEYKGRQELFLKRQPEDLERLVEIAGYPHDQHTAQAALRGKNHAPQP